MYWPAFFVADCVNRGYDAAIRLLARRIEIF
jgi:hypothetical protein